MVIRYYSTMETTAQIKVSFRLTTNTYRRSAPTSERPKVLVTANLISPPIMSIDIRGETDSGTVLENHFRMEHFEFFDLTTSTLVKLELFPGTCDPGDSIYPDGVLELSASIHLETSQELEDPFADVARHLKAGHEYRVRLKPQKIPGYAMSKAELFQGKEHIPVGKLPQSVMIDLRSDDEVVLVVPER